MVTKPFAFEGAHRSRLAEQGLINLKEAVGAMIVIPNDRLLSIVDKETTFLSAFQICDDVLRQAVEGNFRPNHNARHHQCGLRRCQNDYAERRLGSDGNRLQPGRKRAEGAAKMAINSPLLDISIEGAKGVLFATPAGRT